MLPALHIFKLLFFFFFLSFRHTQFPMKTPVRIIPRGYLLFQTYCPQWHTYYSVYIIDNAKRRQYLAVVIRTQNNFLEFHNKTKKKNGTLIGQVNIKLPVFVIDVCRVVFCLEDVSMRSYLKNVFEIFHSEQNMSSQK